MSLQIDNFAPSTMPLRDFDLVGRYSQDEVNGFAEDTVLSLVHAIVQRKPERVLDCMAGDGNLALRCLQAFARERSAIPQIDILEYSQVQSEIARKQLEPFGVRVWNGDVLTMKDLKSGVDLFPDNEFDCVVIKSANHEIPLNSQKQLCAQIYRILKPGGVFFNLGFLFDHPGARDDVRRLAHCKDSLAGFQGAVSNRHFLLREEFYQCLWTVGFKEVQPLRSVTYNISAGRVAKNYFPGDVEKFNVFKDAILNCQSLHELGFIEEKNDDVSFIAEGEITMIQKPV